MAHMHTQWINGNLVFYDTRRDRWIDAVGPDVCKYLEDFVYLPVDDSTGDPLGWTMTVTEAGAGDTTAVVKSGNAGGALLITTAGNENDGWQGQIKGESFKLASGKELYFGIRFKVSEATQSDFLAGLCITDGDCLGAVTDGAYFRKVDGSTQVTFNLEKNSTETSGNVNTCDTDWHIYEFYFTGTYVDHYVDGTHYTRLAVTNLPDDEEMTPTFEFLNGSAQANTVEIDWIRCIQINA